MNKGISVAIISLTLDNFSDIQISAMMNSLSGFGSVSKSNLSYEVALKNGLINELGNPTFDIEDTLTALDHQIRIRPAFGV